MKGYTVANLRQHLAQALDEAERGETVLIERRGRRFRLAVEPAATWKPQPRKVEILDPSLLEDDWGWEWTGPGEPFEYRIHSPAETSLRAAERPPSPPGPPGPEDPPQSPPRRGPRSHQRPRSRPRSR